MNRICFVLDKNGELDSIAADQFLEIFIVAPHVSYDRVYQYTSAEFGVEKVRALIGGYIVGHKHDGTLNDGASAPFPPSKPSLKLVD